MKTSQIIAIMLAMLLLAIPAAADRSEIEGAIKEIEQGCVVAGMDVLNYTVTGRADGDVSGTFALIATTVLVNNTDGLYDSEGFSEGTFTLYSDDYGTYCCNFEGHTQRFAGIDHDLLLIRGKVYPTIASTPGCRILAGGIELRVCNGMDGEIAITRFCRNGPQRSGVIRLNGSPKYDPVTAFDSMVYWATGNATGNLSGYLNATFNSDLTTVVIDPAAGAYGGAGFTRGEYRLHLPDRVETETGRIHAKNTKTSYMRGMFSGAIPTDTSAQLHIPYHGAIEGAFNFSTHAIECAWLEFAGTAPRVTGCGDIDCSGAVNIVDVRLLLNHVRDPTGYPVDPCAGNVNGEGGIDMVDVRLLLAYVFDMAGYPLACS